MQIANKLLLIALICLAINIVQISCQNQNTEYYKFLKLQPQADFSQCQKQCQKLLEQQKNDPEKREYLKRKNHLLTKEYCKVLTDQEKKQIYDQYGENGLRQLEIQGERRQEQQQMFGFMMQQQQRKQTTDNKSAEIPATLEELYNGGSVSFTIQRKELCSHCNGTGDKSGKLQRCSHCQGRGQTLRTVNMGGFQMQTQEVCHKCGGKGRSGKGDCPVCRGQRLVQENSKIDIQIKPGMKDKSKIIKKGMSDQHPELDAGDLVFFIKEKEHSQFKRLENDLYYINKITLKEAIFGYNKELRLLDGSTITLQSKPDQVSQQSYRQIHQGRGMPIEKPKRGGSQFGDLIIQNEIQFPTRVSSRQKEILQKIFALDQ